MFVHTQRVGLLIGIVQMSACLVLAEEPADYFNRPLASWLSAESRAGGEDEEEIETDRDSFTPATTTVKAGRTIYESSYSFIENRDTANTHSFPEIITRFGVTDRIEFRLGWNYEIGGGGSVSGGDPGGEELQEPGLVRESQMLYGLKYSLNKQQGWIPQSACIIQATSPTSGPDNFSDLQLNYVFGWKFFNDWQLDSSLRYLSTREEGDHFNLWAPSVVLKVPVADRWNVHAEYFGTFSAGRAVGQNPQYFSPGIHYLITPGLEVGTRVGWGLNNDAASFFANVGFGLLF
ncbi:MAG: transporter [Planctomycetes bacterium]|nr:transporter [Planctomycetota bacterium]